MNTRKKTATRGFTLIELLTVIAIIGILAAILFPVVGKVRESAGETAGKAQLSQWAQAFELFRQEYGYYPSFGQATNDLLINRAPGDSDGNGAFKGERFYETLTGRLASDPSKRVSSGDEGFDAGNVRAASFYDFAEGEAQEENGNFVIRDRFGNADIVVMFDRTQNGIIEFGGSSDDDYPTTLPSVIAVNSGREFNPTVGDGPGDLIPTTGVRANVIFYSGGYGNRLLTSWQ